MNVDQYYAQEKAIENRFMAATDAELETVHWSTSWWRPFVTRIDMDPYPDRKSARAGEALTIKNEVPLYNIHKNPNCEAVHGEWKREQERRYQEARRALDESGWISPLDEIFSRS